MFQIVNLKWPYWLLLLSFSSKGTLYHYNFSLQNQNSLLVKRQNDNTSPGDWPRKISL